MFYLTTNSTHFIYIRHKDHPLPPHGLIFLIWGGGLFTCPGSGMPTMRPKTGYPVKGLGAGGNSTIENV